MTPTTEAQGCQPRLLRDNREAQAERVADFMEPHPASTAKEIDAVADTGSITKVLSEMRRMGYGLTRGWRAVPRPGGLAPRRVRTYTLLHRPQPKAQADLFKPQ